MSRVGFTSRSFRQKNFIPVSKIHKIKVLSKFPRRVVFLRLKYDDYVVTMLPLLGQHRVSTVKAHRDIISHYSSLSYTNKRKIQGRIGEYTKSRSRFWRKMRLLSVDNIQEGIGA